MFKVGKKYYTKDEGAYKCIAVTETHAWMKSSENQTAYVWTQEGKSLSLSSDYDIKPQPREYWLCTDAGQNTCILEEKPTHHWDEVIHVREVLE